MTSLPTLPTAGGRTIRGQIALAFMCAVTAAYGCDAQVRRLAVRPSQVRTLPPPRQRLRPTAHRVRWESHTVPPQMKTGADVDVRLGLTNISDETWPDILAGNPEKRDGSFAVRLAHGWRLRGQVEPRRPPLRVDLPRPLGPGETITLLINLKAPAQAGEYELQFELLQETATWFDTAGGTNLFVPVTVMPRE